MTQHKLHYASRFERGAQPDKQKDSQWHPISEAQRVRALARWEDDGGQVNPVGLLSYRWA